MSNFKIDNKPTGAKLGTYGNELGVRGRRYLLSLRNGAVMNQNRATYFL